MNWHRAKKAILVIVISLFAAEILDFAFGYPMAFRVGDWRERLGEGPAGRPVYLVARLIDEKPAYRHVPLERDAEGALEEIGCLNMNSPYPASVTLGMDRFRIMNRRVLLAPPPSEIAFRVTIPARAELSFGYGVKSPEDNKLRNGARFIVEWHGRSGRVRLFEHEVVNQPAGFWDKNRERRKIWYRYLRPGYMRWGDGYQDASVDLSAYSGQEGELWFITEGLSGDRSEALSPAVWSNPELWAEHAEGEDPRLNVLLFMIEATPVSLVQPYVDRPAVTPNIREFAGSAVVFDKFFTSGDDTRFSTFPLFTGRHYLSMGLPKDWFFLAPFVEARFYTAHYATLPEAFSQAGYKTALVGSNRFFLSTSEIGLDIGFDELDVMRRRHYEPEDTVHGVMEWLRVNGNKPFFLYIHYNGPHNVDENPCLEYMVRALPVWNNDFRWPYKKKLAKEIGADCVFGCILSALDTLGIRDRTLVIVTADHGSCVEPAHNLAVVKSYSQLWHSTFTHGRTMFLEDIHVPLIIDWPAGPGEERHVSAPVTSLDMFPTLVDLMLPEPDPEFRKRMEGISGKSLAGTLAETRGPALSGHPVVYSLSRCGQGIIVDGRYHYFQRNHKYYRIIYPGKNRMKVEQYGLFDLESDPGELNNLAESRPGLLSLMQELLDQARPEERVLRFIYMNYEAGRVRGSLGIAGDVPPLVMTYPEERSRIDVHEKASGADEKILDFEFELQGPTGLILDRPVRWTQVSVNSERVSGQGVRIGPFGLPLLKDSRCGHPGGQILIEGCGDISGAMFLSAHNPVQYMDEPGVYFYAMKFSDFVEETFSDESLSPAVRSALKQWGYIE
jgi:arylsulfatase A-like enzyme